MIDVPSESLWSTNSRFRVYYNMMSKGNSSKNESSSSKDNSNTNSNSISNNNNNTIVHRDIYRREQRVRYWLDKVEQLPEEDRKDVLRYIEYMQEEKISALRMIKCIEVLLLAKVIRARFKDATKEDIKRFVEDCCVE